ncbi:hypothetical protein [Bacillus thuringiensis]|uniref:hypothetical protein n=1 Tax=Bacillus thuringiensis TaxID=1428 RepID=UPI0015E0B359|nr:hypothetical protein [Bacillus thuringiensis]
MGQGDSSSKPIGTRYNTSYVSGGNNKKQFQSKHSSAYVALSSEAKKTKPKYELLS